MTNNKDKLIIFFAAIALALVFFAPINSAQAGLSWSQAVTTSLPAYQCTGTVGPFSFNSPIRSPGMSVSGNTNGASVGYPSWLNNGSGDPLTLGASAVTITSSSYRQECDKGSCSWVCDDFTVNWVCTGWGQDCDEYGCTACCDDGWWCEGATGYYTTPVSSISATLTFSGTRNYIDEPNLAPGYGAAGYPYGANIGVTTAAVTSLASAYPVLNWGSYGSAQQYYRAQVWSNGWGSLLWDSSDVGSGAQSVSVGTALSVGTYNWRVASAGPTPGYSYSSWTGWANGDAFTVCYDTSWSPDPSTVCSGTSFTQTSNCGNTRSATGTMCCDTSWSPDPATVCSGTSFTQTSNCGNTRSATGTRPDATWSPDPSTVYTGQTFTQTSDCGHTRSSVGTMPSVPSAINLGATQPNYCSSGPAASLSWSFSDPQSGDTQGSYQVQIDNNSNFSSPEVNTGKVTSSSNSYATPAGALAYNNTYYWRVMVWDNHDTASAWASGSSFATPTHQYPGVNFSWAPLYPSLNESVQFADQSTVYGGATKSSWSWVIPGATYIGDTDSSSQNPHIKFTTLGNREVTLTLTDSTGFVCTAARIVTTRFSLPNWREIAPW